MSSEAVKTSMTIENLDADVQPSSKQFFASDSKQAKTMTDALKDGLSSGTAQDSSDDQVHYFTVV
jgi:hypothetical protein